jgi:hypothetical protein
MSRLAVTEFAGVFQAINPSNDWECPREEEVTDDVEGEQETLPDEHKSAHSKNEGSSADRGAMAQLQDSLLNVSKGVTEGTDNEYRRPALILLGH